MGSGKVVIIEFRAEGRWREDTTSDPLRRATLKGAWVTTKTAVWPERIVAVHPLTREVVKGAVKANRLEGTHAA
jgi:hypothetical protein